MRRITRPGARLARTLPFAGDITPGSLLTGVDAGEVSAAPPVVTPPGLVTTDEVVDAIDVAPLPPWVPAPVARWLLDLLRRYRWMHWLVLALAIVLLVGGLVLVGVTGGTVAAALGTVVIVVALVAVALWWALRRSEAQLDRADGLRPGALTVEAVDRLPDAPGFEITTPGTPATPAPTGATGDSPTAVRFKDRAARLGPPAPGQPHRRRHRRAGGRPVRDGWNRGARRWHGWQASNRASRSRSGRWPGSRCLGASSPTWSRTSGR